MPDERFRNDAAVMAHISGLPVPDERLDALQMGLAANQIGAKAISAHDFGAAEPAYRFTPPKPR